MLVDIFSETAVKRTLPSIPKRSQIERDGASEKQAAQDAKQTTTVTVFTNSGKHIISGTNKGWINIIETDSCQTIHSFRLTKKIVIFVRLTASGRVMVVNSSDTIIRTVHIPDFTDKGLDVDNLRIEVEHEFSDRVNRLTWNHVALSSNGEFVVASTFMNHDIYVWERGHGSLVKILEGPKEELSVVEVCIMCETKICLLTK